MTAKNITNTTEASITLPNGQSILPGRTIRVENWEAVESNSVVRSHMDAAAITVANAPKRAEPEDDTAEADTPKGKAAK